MRKIMAMVMLLGTSYAAAPAYADPQGEIYGADERRSGSGTTRIQTGPLVPGETAEDKARNYRGCLFTFLPRVGSDVAAGLIRDACRDEYMR